MTAVPSFSQRGISFVMREIEGGGIRGNLQYLVTNLQDKHLCSPLSDY